MQEVVIALRGKLIDEWNGNFRLIIDILLVVRIMDFINVSGFISLSIRE